jgi:hypothetical protein
MGLFVTISFPAVCRDVGAWAGVERHASGDPLNPFSERRETTRYH